MRKAFVIIFAFNCYCTNPSYAQKTISLSATSAAGYHLNVSKKIEIINNLPDSNVLGYIPSEISNDREFIKSSAAITPWLQNFINKQFVSNPDANTEKLLWVIDDLSMGTDSTQNEVNSYLKLKADIYSGTNDNYQLINTFDSTWIVKGDGDFGKMIGETFLSLYQNSSAEPEKLSNKRFYTINQKFQGTADEIKIQTKAGKQIAVLQNNIHPKGVYTSFEEFKNNTPSITNFYADVDIVTKKVQLYQIAADSSSSLIQNVWGISVNNELYYYDEGQLYPIEKSGNTFYMAKYLEPRTRKNQAFYWRKIIGARQGDTNPYNDSHELLKIVPTADNVSLEATHLDFDKKDFIY